MSCVKAESHVQCMYYIDQAGKGEAVGADVVVLDAGDVYRLEISAQSTKIYSRTLTQFSSKPGPAGSSG